MCVCVCCLSLYLCVCVESLPPSLSLFLCVCVCVCVQSPSLSLSVCVCVPLGKENPLRTLFILDVNRLHNYRMSGYKPSEGLCKPLKGAPLKTPLSLLIGARIHRGTLPARIEVITITRFNQLSFLNLRNTWMYLMKTTKA